MKRFAVVAAVCAMLLAIVALPVSGADTGVLTIAAFDGDTAGWQRGDNVSEVFCTLYTPEDSYGEPSRGCLAVMSYDLAVNLMRSARVELVKPLNLIEYRTFSYELYVPPYEADPDAVYYTRLIMHTEGGETIESLETLEAGCWTRIDVDIGSYRAREAITSIEIGVLVSTTVDGYNKTNFYIDELSARSMVDRELTDRFLFDLYTVSGGSAELSADKTQLKLRVNGDILLLDAATILPELDRPVNRLRIKLANRTDIDTLTLYYTTSDTLLLSEYKSVEIRLERQSDSRYYYADVGDASMLHNIRMQFGEGVGMIELDSISVISEYEPEEYDSCGTITSCLLSDDLRSISISGEILRDEALSNRNGRVAVYALEPGEVLDLAALTQSMPLVTTPMTTKLELQITDFREDTLYKKFVVLSLDENGSAKTVAAPFYLSNPERLADVSLDTSFGVKGLVCGDPSEVGRAGADVTVLLLSLDDAFASRSEGERYVCLGETYYLDADYLDALDRSVRAMRGAGVSTLIRMTLEERSISAKLDAFYAEDTHVNYSSYSNKPDGNKYLAAISSYIAERWMADGSVSGVIYDQGANILKDGETLDEAIRKTAVDIRTVYQCLTSVNSQARVYLSVTDVTDVELASKSDEIGLIQYLRALAAELRGGQPTSNSRFALNLCIEELYRADSDDVCISASDCEAVTKLLMELGLSESRLIFCDNTLTLPRVRVSDAIAACVSGYYGAYFDSRVDAYIPIVSSGANANRIMECMRLIDTEDGEIVASLALSTLKLGKWSELISNYDPRWLSKKQLREVEASLELPSDIKGTYSYYTFDSFGESELEPSYHCSSLTVDNGRLVAELSSSVYSSTSSMGVAKRFEYPENLTLTPTLAITLTLDDVAPSELTEAVVKLVLTSASERFEASAVVPIGQQTTVYVDLGEFDNARSTEGFQLFVEGVRSATLSIERIDGLSREYNDESLESVIADERERIRSPQSAAEYGAYICVAGAIIVAVATILTVVLLSRKKRNDT